MKVLTDTSDSSSPASMRARGKERYEFSLLRAPRIEKIYDESAALSMLNPNLETLLSRFADQSEKSRSIILSEIYDKGLRAALVDRLYAEYFGVLPEHAPPLLRRCTIGKEPFFDGKIYSTLGLQRFTLGENIPAKLNSEDRRRRIKTFPCEFRMFPARFGREINHVDTTRAKIFAMYLPPDEMRSVLNASDRLIRSDLMHVTGAFAYLRFYTTDLPGGNMRFDIAEIQSDHFHKLNRGRQEPYKHWQEMLITAFEVCVSPLGDERRNAWVSMLENLREMDAVGAEEFRMMIDPKLSSIAASHKGYITIPLPQTIQSRWSHGAFDAPRAVAVGKAEAIYARVPQKLDYSLEAARESYFPEADLSGYRIPTLFSWHKFIRPLDALASDSFTAQLAPHLEDQGDHDLNKALDLYESVVPPFIFANLHRDGLSVSYPTMGATTKLLNVLPGAVAVPVEPIPVRSIHGLTESMHQSLQAQLKAPQIAFAAAVLEPEFSFFSKGREHGLAANWWQLEIQSRSEIGASILGIENQTRHPSLRLWHDTLRNNPTVCVGAKGAGLTVRNPDDFWFPAEGNRRSDEFPILKCAPQRDEICPSHVYWGGLRLDHAIAEYRNSVGLTHLFHSLGEDASKRIAIPLGVAKLNSVPLFTEKGLDWVDASQYLFNVLEEQGKRSEEHLAVYLSASRSDVRLSQVVNRVMTRTDSSRENLEVCRQEINSALRYLFSVHGFSLDTPENLYVEPCDGTIGPREYQRYVNQLMEHNEEAGRTIYSRISKRIVSSMGLIHGAGGHVGGGCLGYDADRGVGSIRNTIGAVGGGACTVRNVDCYGALHDLDVEVLLPWVQNERREPILPLSIIQSFDQMFMAETLYWFRAMLTGVPISESDQLQQFSLVNPFNKVSFFSSHREITEPIPPQAFIDELCPSMDVLKKVTKEPRLPGFESLETTIDSMIREKDLFSSLFAGLRITEEEDELYLGEVRRGQAWSRRW